MRRLTCICTLGLALLGTLGMSISNVDTVEAQRGGGGGGGRPGGGGGKGGGPGGKGGGPGGKGGEGGGYGGYKKKDVNSETQMADWKQPRDSTWEKAKKDKLPIVMVFMPFSEAANAKYFIGKDVAEISRGKSIWVQVLENHHQILKGEKGYKDPEPEPEEGSEDADGEAPAPEEAPADAPKDGPKDTPKDDKAKSFGIRVVGEISSRIVGQAAPAPAAAEPVGPTFVAPLEKLYRNNLWKSFGVTKPNTFLVLDHLGNEYKRFDEKPTTTAVVSEINKMAKAIERDEKQLLKDHEDVLKAQEKGDQKAMLKAIREGFARGRYGYEGTDKLNTVFETMLKAAREKKASLESSKSVKELEELKKLWAGSVLEAELDVSIAVLKGAKK